MRVSVLCTSIAHPILPSLRGWVIRQSARHEVRLAERLEDVAGGDLLLLISCVDIVDSTTRSRFRHCLVVHASALPQGRGWSPHVWQILEGSNVIPVVLFAAEDAVDTGAIWAQESLTLNGNELFDEINSRLFAVTLKLMDFAVENFATAVPRPQPDVPATYYRRRTPADSRLDPDKTLAAQFDLLRVADPQRYPCFLEHRGARYTVMLKKEDAA